MSMIPKVHPYDPNPAAEIVPVWTDGTPNRRDLIRDKWLVTQDGEILLVHQQFWQMSFKSHRGEQNRNTMWENATKSLSIAHVEIPYDTIDGHNLKAMALPAVGAIDFIQKNADLFSNPERDKISFANLFEKAVKSRIARVPDTIEILGGDKPITMKRAGTQSEFDLTPEPDQPSFALIPRELDGVPIPQREADGYVNISAWLKTASARPGAKIKRWANYLDDSATNRAFVAELSRVTGIPVTAVCLENEPSPIALYYSRQGGIPALQGTWVHPKLAVEVARWADPKLAVIMNEWCYRFMKGEIPQQEAPQLDLNSVGGLLALSAQLTGMLVEHKATIKAQGDELEKTRPSHIIVETFSKKEGVLFLCSEVARKFTPKRQQDTFDYLREIGWIPKSKGKKIFACTVAILPGYMINETVLCDDGEMREHGKITPKGLLKLADHFLVRKVAEEMIREAEEQTGK